MFSTHLESRHVRGNNLHQTLGQYDVSALGGVHALSSGPVPLVVVLVAPL